MPIRSAHPPTFYTFAGATTAPLLFVLLTSVDPFYQLVGIAGGAYVGHLMAYVRDVHSWQYDNIALAQRIAGCYDRRQIHFLAERLGIMAELHRLPAAMSAVRNQVVPEATAKMPFVRGSVCAVRRTRSPAATAPSSCDTDAVYAQRAAVREPIPNVFRT